MKFNLKLACLGSVDFSDFFFPAPFTLHADSLNVSMRPSLEGDSQDIFPFAAPDSEKHGDITKEFVTAPRVCFVARCHK